MLMESNTSLYSESVKVEKDVPLQVIILVVAILLLAAITAIKGGFCDHSIHPTYENDDGHDVFVISKSDDDIPSDVQTHNLSC